MSKRVAYITSGKIGIHRFTFNELVLLEKENVAFDLCLTQLRKGPCMPNENWSYYVAQKKKAILEFFTLLFSGKEVLKLLFEARKRKVLPYFFIALSFHRDIKNNGNTVLHCQMGDEKLYIGYFLKRIMKIPLTVTVHAHELYKRKVYDDNEEIKRLYDSCDKVITISDFNAKLINDSFGVANDKVEVMRLFPDIDHMNLVNDKVKILIVANWAEKKGYDVLLKALKRLKDTNYVLWVVGETYFSDNSIDVRALVKEYEMEDKVAILGRQTSPILDVLFYACDIFCLPSYTEFYSDGKPAEREGIPVAIMEAMAWGKPVIATNHAGNAELVEDVLVEERNVDDLYNALKTLINNPNDWKKMGDYNKDITDRKFSKKNISTLVNLFNKL